MFVTRILHGNALENVRIHIFQIGQARFVELLKNARLYLPLKKVGRWYHHVVTGVPREKFGLKYFIGIEYVIVNLDTRLGFEILERSRINVV